MVIPILLSVGFTPLLFAAFLGIGCAALRLVRAEALFGGAFGIIVRIGLGFGVLGNAVMALCFLHLAHRWIIVGMTLAAVLATAPFLIAYRGEPRRYALKLFTAARHHPLLFFPAALLLCGYFVLGLLPPADFDALMYHLSTIKLYLEHGGFFNIYFNRQSDYPMLTEMVYMIGLALGNDIICKTVAFGLSSLLLATIAVASRRCAGLTSGQTIAALLVFLTSTCVIATYSSCNVDMAQALWMLLSVMTFESWIRKPSGAGLLVCAFFAGMALETKVFGVFILPVLFARLAWDPLALPDVRRVPFMRRMAPLVPLCTIALFMGLPWYLKSLYYKGTILSATHAVIVGQGLGVPLNMQVESPFWQALLNTVVRIAAAPWTFSLFPGQHQSDTFGPLFIAVLPFLLLTGIPRPARFLALAALAYWAMVIFMEMVFIEGGSSIRYSTMVLAVGAIFIPVALAGLRKHGALRRLLTGFVVVMVFLGAVLFVKRYHREWRAFLTLQSRDAYYTALLPHYPLIRHINRIGDGSRVMPIYNYDDYLIDIPYVTAYTGYTDAEAFTKDLQEKRVRYIYANDRFDTAANAHAFPQLPHKKIIGTKNGFYLYELTGH